MTVYAELGLVDDADRLLFPGRLPSQHFCELV